MGQDTLRYQDIERNVFVVHGRNKAAREAIIAFLKAVGLTPIMWTDAVQLTKKATPTTLEVVNAGISAAQAVVLLFTSDDHVQLRSELGNEPPSYQPRPNVLLEAGIALAVAGTDRTLLIKAGASKEVTDLAGLNYIPLLNEPEYREDFVNRLELAGCAVDRSSGDYLRPEKTGNFEEITGEEEQPNLLLRGGFTSFIVDSSISHKLNSMELFKQAEEYLSGSGSIDLKYSYIGTIGASNWLAISSEPTYAHSDLLSLYRKFISEVVTKSGIAGDYVDYISLGCGDGEIDVAIVRELENSTKLVNYYPFDISLELLQKSTQEVLESAILTRNFRVKAIHGDFHHLNRYRPIFGYDRSINIFGLLGFTMGNHAEGNLLGKIREGMNVGDILILDARVHELGPDVSTLLSTQKDDIIRNYSHRLHNRFVFGPVEALTDAAFATAVFRHEVNQFYTDVPGALNVVVSLENLLARMRSRPEKKVRQKRISLGVTTIYDQDSLRGWLVNRGFDLVCEKKEKGAVAFVLRKTS